MRLSHWLASMVLGVLALGSAACHRVRVSDVRTTDGSDWKKVSCRHMDKHCFKTAERLCPGGYYFTRAGQQVVARHANASAADADSDDGATTTQPHDGLPAGATVKTLPPQETWDRGMYSRRSGAILIQCATQPSG